MQRLRRQQPLRAPATDTRQTVVILVKITKMRFLAQESQFKQGVAMAGGVVASQVDNQYQRDPTQVCACVAMFICD